VIRTAGSGGEAPSQVMRSSSRVTASRAIAEVSGAMVVSETVAYRPSSVSSNPTTATSSGTRRPCWARARIAPSASWSVTAKDGVGRGAAAAALPGEQPGRPGGVVVRGRGLLPAGRGGWSRG
jgi:hypothetical protein